MLNSGALIQDRYHIRRQIGGGGMGTVYLAEDTRLSGRQCAIKEMSPNELAPSDRNWSIQAFRQEAQMLAQLDHPGLTRVTDFFPEGGNWYLVMDYVEGETLEARLMRAPQGRLPIDRALPIARQLCDVLTYLHNRQPSVIFRDLKPGNIMLTPNDEVKLIDFGIARFFKPGKTQDTVLLGTPGYAAPEQYGGRGQSDPRTDVYSLGALLHHMITGHDPTTASSPFPLPEARSVMPSIPPSITDVIGRATQMRPALRYATIQEMQQALFPPTYQLPGQPGSQPASPWGSTPTPNQSGSNTGSTGGSNRGLWIGLAVIGTVLLLCAGGTIGAIATGIIPNRNSETPTVELPGETATMKPITHTPTQEFQTVTPTEPPPATEVPTLTTKPTSTEGPIRNETVLGRSVQGRDLVMTSIGYEGDTHVIVIGSIQGDQTTTRDLIQNLIRYLDQNHDAIPQGVQYHLIPTINPDGNTENSRYNANGVDLNRNWDTKDWKSSAAVPGYPEGKTGSGGSYAFSEPETQALRDLLHQFQSDSPSMRIVIYHSSVRRSKGEVYPGGDRSLDISRTYAEATGYDIEHAWAEYVTSGEAVTWCDEQAMLAIDVVIPASQSPHTQVYGNKTLLEITLQALEDIANYR
jgi:serine/threonine-protein kinase